MENNNLQQLLQTADLDVEFSYQVSTKQFNNACRVRFFNRQPQIIILTELKNSGMSVTNSIEFIIPQLERFLLFGKAIALIMGFPADWFTVLAKPLSKSQTTQNPTEPQEELEADILQVEQLRQDKQQSPSAESSIWLNSQKLLGDKDEIIKKAAGRWYGGKWLMGKWIASHFPNHRVYVEPFGGMFSVGLQKPTSKTEIYNDLHKHAVNFWIQLRDRPQELISLIKQTEFSRETLDWAKNSGLDELDQAHRFYCQCLLTFEGGGGRSSGTSKQRIARAQKHQHDHLLAIANRIQNLTIKNVDAFSIIEEYDSPETLFYIDPCYLPNTRSKGNNYLHDMTENDHVELAKLLNKVKGKVVVSGYYSQLYDSLYKNWDCYSKQSKTTSRNKADEYLWLNFKLLGDKLSIPCLIRQPHKQSFEGLIVGDCGCSFDVQVGDRVVQLPKLYVFPNFQKKRKGLSRMHPQANDDISPSKIRRKKGTGSGYINWRAITKNGKEYKQPWFHYELWDKGRQVKSCKYIPKGKRSQVEKMNAEKVPVEEILKFLKSKGK